MKEYYWEYTPMTNMVKKKYPKLFEEYEDLSSWIEVVQQWFTESYVDLIPLIAPFTAKTLYEERGNQFSGNAPNAELEAKTKRDLEAFCVGLSKIKPEPRFSDAHDNYYGYMWYIFVIRSYLSKELYVHASHMLLDLWVAYPILEERIYATLIHLISYYCEVKL